MPLKTTGLIPPLNRRCAWERLNNPHQGRRGETLVYMMAWGIVSTVCEGFFSPAQGSCASLGRTYPFEGCIRCLRANHRLASINMGRPLFFIFREPMVSIKT